jgi:hypothetical protein
MSNRSRSQHQRTDITFDDACDLLTHVLAGPARQRILDRLTASDDGAVRLRGAMRSHTFPTDGETVRLQRIVQSFDTRSRRAGLHLLESWDYVAHRFADEITPVLMLDRCALDRIPADRQRASFSVLLDHYFMSVVGLVVAHAWDQGDPNRNLDRATELLAALQGDQGSRCRFVADVETLLLAAVSHYHPAEHVYEVVARRLDDLAGSHRRNMALACAAVLAGHLRWGLRFMYRRDLGRMRDDNVVDYPFVLYGALQLMRDYEHERSLGEDDLEHQRTVEAVLNGLSADPLFATSKTPQWLRSHRDEHVELRERVLDCRDDLLTDFAAHVPSPRSYSPLGFDANFLCNTVVAMVATALAAELPAPSLNALFTGLPCAECSSAEAERQARTLMAYALGNRIAAEAPLVVYDPHEAAHAFNVTNTVLRQADDVVPQNA